MLRYNTGIPVPQPLTPGMRDGALVGLTQQYAGVPSDLYTSMAQRNAVNYDRSAQQENADFVNRARAAQLQMAERGLQQMAQSQQQQSDLGRQQQQYGYDRTLDAMRGVNNILRGLF